MSVLFRRSNFFIELKSILTYSDLYVLERILEWGYANKLDLSIFTSLENEYTTIGRDGMKYKLQSKQEVNFLMDYVDWNFVVSQCGEDPTMFCNTLYNTMLYQEFDIDSKDSPELIMTPLADTIRILTKDSNTESVVIYMAQPCDYIQKQISTFFQSDKITFVSEDKHDFLSKKSFDSYFFENIEDVNIITRWHDQRSEVVVPTFSFNVEEYDIDKDGTLVYSPGSFFKLPILDEEEIPKYLTKYNLDVAFLDIPL